MVWSDQTMRPRWLAALICADSTPGTRRKASSMVSAQAAQCMPSNTTLDSQQDDWPGSDRLKAVHSCGSSSIASGVALAALAGLTPGRPDEDKGRGDRLTVCMMGQLSDFIGQCFE